MEFNKSYTIFFSWQSTRPDVKKAIMKMLSGVVKELSKDGIDLCLDQDTWNRVGKKRIDVEVLNKIDNCDIFIADLTPVCKIEADEDEDRLEKLQPNANVMFEYGYALKAKGEERMILLANLEKGEHREHLPFDINHDTITAFTMEKGVPSLLKPIKKMVELIDKERMDAVREYDCTILLDALSANPVFRPKYKRRHYVAPGEVPQNQLEKRLPAEYGGVSMQKGLKAIAKSGRWDSLAKMDVDTMFKQKYNESLCALKPAIFNCGLKALENCEILIKLVTPHAYFDNKQSIWMQTSSNIAVDMVTRNTIFAKVDVLNPSALEYITDIADTKYIHLPYDCAQLNVIWTVHTKTTRIEGRITCSVTPEFVDTYVEDLDRAGEVEIVDFEEIR